MTVPDTPDNEHDPENAWSESIFTERTQEILCFHQRILGGSWSAVVRLTANATGTQLIICVNLRSFAAKKSMFGRSQFRFSLSTPEKALTPSQSAGSTPHTHPSAACPGH